MDKLSHWLVVNLDKLNQREIWKWAWCILPLPLHHRLKRCFWKAPLFSHICQESLFGQAFESWTDILVCCFFGVTFGDLIKEITFKQLSGRKWPGLIERRAFDKIIFGVQGSLAKSCPSRTSITSTKLRLENMQHHWLSQMFI